MSAEIKFCGLTRPEDAAFAASLGAQYVGVIFAGGPRHQTPDGATRIFAATPPPPKRVGVVSGQTPDEIAALVELLALDVVQLHADPSVARIRAVREAVASEVWAVMRIEGSTLPPSFEDTAFAADAVVLDARVPSGLGGSGVSLPWAELAESLQQRRGTARIVLAGGLRPENIAAAIADIEPSVVDVSSGVESAPGIKDHQRMRAFRDAVLSAGVKR